MFENPSATFSTILFTGMAIIWIVNRICHNRDLFLGRARDIRHREEHWDNESAAVILALVVASCGFLVSLAISSFTKPKVEVAQKKSLPAQLKLNQKPLNAPNSQTTKHTTDSLHNKNDHHHIHQKYLNHLPPSVGKQSK